MERREFLAHTGMAGALLLSGCTEGSSARAAGAKNSLIPKVSAEEWRAMIAGMRPPKRKRPIVAVVADNIGSETTDFIIPYSVLSRSELADVRAVGATAGVINFMPALSIMAQASLAQFDASTPDGPDYIIVPATHREQPPEVVAWIKQHAARGATIVGICAGVKLLGHAGLLDGRKATSHWYEISGLKRHYPTMEWQPNRRFVVDRGVITTTGVSASVPVSLALIEAISDRATADNLAAKIGAPVADANHVSDHFQMNASRGGRFALNMISFWRDENFGIEVAQGIDELALALTADPWSRTYISQAYTVAKDSRITTLSGLDLVVDRPIGQARPKHMIALDPNARPFAALDTNLNAIEARFGSPTAHLAALQMEYEWAGTRSD